MRKVVIICDLIDESQKTGIWNFQEAFVSRLVESKNEAFEFLFVHEKPNPLTAQMGNLVYPNFFYRLPSVLRFFIRWAFRGIYVPFWIWISRADVVHNLNYANPIFFDWLGGHKRTVTLYDLIPLLDKSYASRIERMFAYIWFHVSLKRADLIYSISDSSKLDAVRFWIDANRIRTEYIWPTRELSHWSVEEVSASVSWRYVLAVSSIAPHKNLEWLVDAFHLLKTKESYRDLKLVLVGKRRIFHESLRRKTEGDESIIFTWFISNEELDSLYRHAEAFVVPSKVEGFWLPIVEAMANGCAVAASNRTSIPEVVGGAGVYFDPDDSAEMAQAIEKLLVDKNLRKTLVAKWFEQIKKFDMGTHVEHVLSSFIEISTKDR